MPFRVNPIAGANEIEAYQSLFFHTPKRKIELVKNQMNNYNVYYRELLLCHIVRSSLGIKQHWTTNSILICYYLSDILN